MNKYFEKEFIEKKLDEQKFDDIIIKEFIEKDLDEEKYSKKLSSIQNIYMNNLSKSTFKNIDFIWNNINSSDELIINSLYSSINNFYQKKINLINLLLRSDQPIPLKTKHDFIKFFIMLSPLNIEFMLGSKNWIYKIVKFKNSNYMFFHNSISKVDCNDYFYKNFIDLIKKTFDNSNIDYYYFQFKAKRFNKTNDLIFVLLI